MVVQRVHAGAEVDHPSLTYGNHNHGAFGETKMCLNEREVLSGGFW